ncbi:MAG TPA: hypothetical protein VG325_03100 [Solirubrobacteraceae bacterium]|jgi:hypothetical protein|nr:hypothetical protein [Solirubrobacteraceae bacterium]
MKETVERRLAANEDVFRKVNEGIERGQWPGWAGGADAPIAFRCECARLGCNKLLTLTLSDYERVRADARQFVVLAGHEVPSVERIVERRGEIVIVVKTGAAAHEAAERDPRS